MSENTTASIEQRIEYVNGKVADYLRKNGVYAVPTEQEMKGWIQEAKAAAGNGGK